MTTEIVVVGVVALLISTLATGVVRKLAQLHGLLDVPNERSSHVNATPRGGGISIVLALTMSLGVLALLDRVPMNLFLALFGGGLAVAAIGFLDDRRPVSPGIRLAVHVGSAVWAVFWIGGLPALRAGDEVLRLGSAGAVLAVLGLTWTLNLFNFMDGIDGIAASEAVFIACGGVLAAVAGAGAAGIPAVCVVFGAAGVGFLLWNWPPAKIFMGDVGSGYLGFVIGVLALTAARANPSALWVWLILGAVFFVDATVTLVRRLLRGDRVYEAHRSHAYQWLARRWGSHGRVTMAVLILNVVWLLPCALLATLYPDRAVWIAACALAPVVVMAFILGSGRREIRIS